jgi:hypothetical protein
MMGWVGVGVGGQSGGSGVGTTREKAIDRGIVVVWEEICSELELVDEEALWSSSRVNN